MQTQSALEREGRTVDSPPVRLEDLKDDTLALLHAQYVDATLAHSDTTSDPFQFQVPRELLISELGRMVEYLRKF